MILYAYTKVMAQDRSRESASSGTGPESVSVAGLNKACEEALIVLCFLGLMDWPGCHHQLAEARLYLPLQTPPQNPPKDENLKLEDLNVSVFELRFDRWCRNLGSVACKRCRIRGWWLQSQPLW